MCTVRFIADPHLGHIGMAVNYRHFHSVDEQTEYLITQWNKVVKKRDLTYILGDLAMENKNNYYLLEKLNGRKKVIAGNHELPHEGHMQELLKYVETISGAVSYKGYLLTHIPVHTSILNECRGNIHGHTHRNRVLKEPMLSDYCGQPHEKYFNVCCDVLDFTPISLDELFKK